MSSHPELRVWLLRQALFERDLDIETVNGIVVAAHSPNSKRAMLTKRDLRRALELRGWTEIEIDAVTAEGCGEHETIETEEHEEDECQ